MGLSSTEHYQHEQAQQKNEDDHLRKYDSAALTVITFL